MPTLDKSHPEAGFVELEPLAIGAIDFVWVIISLVCILVTIGFWVIFTILDDLFGRVNIFGFHPFGFIRGLLSWAMKKEWSWMEAEYNSFTNWLWSQISVVWRFMYVAVVSIVGLWEQVVGLTQRNTNDTSSEAIRAQKAESDLQAQLNFDIGVINGEIGDLNRSLNVIDTLTVPNILDEITNLQAEIAGISPADETGAINNLTTELNNLTGELHSVESTVNTTIANEITNLQNTVSGNLTKLEQEITNGVNTAETFASQLAPGIQAGAVATVLAQLVPRLAKVETEVTECLDPLCDTVSPNAQRAGRNLNWLKDLEALGVEALIVALAAECLTNPRAVVDDVTTVVNDVGKPVFDAGKALIGA